MINKDIKELILKETNLNKALHMLEPYKDLTWDEDIIRHLQEITPDDEVPISDFSYTRRIK